MITVATKMAFLRRFHSAAVVARQKQAVFNEKGAMAQAASETGWGTSKVCHYAQNLFGLKAKPPWTGPTYEADSPEDEGGATMVVRTSVFRRYPSWNECILDYSRFIQSRPWFQDCLPYADPPDGLGDAEQWLRHLADKDYEGELTWGTDRTYLGKCLQKLMDLQDLTIA